MLGLAAGLAGIATVRRSPVALPRVLSVPAVLLVALLVQLMLNRLPFPRVGMLYAAYLIWAGLLMILGRRLADTLGLGRLGDVLACGFALGAFLSATVAVVQWLGFAAGLPWVFPRTGSGVYGNLGQANHFAHYSWLGIASLFYLRERGHLPRSVFWLLTLPIALGSIASGSRSVYLYAMLVVVFVAWSSRRERKSVGRNILVDAAALLPCLLVLDFVFVSVSSYLDGLAAPASSAVRLYQEVSGPSIRIALARTAWAAFLDHPWLGHGVGDFAWASFLVSARETSGAPTQVAENAHNLVLGALGEFGAPATMAGFVFLAAWAKAFVRSLSAQFCFWWACMLGIGLAYALLEYPFWYAYFLGPVALMLGAVDARDCPTVRGGRATAYLALMALSGIAILATLRTDYLALEAVSRNPKAAYSAGEHSWQGSVERLKRLQSESLLSPWALLAFAEFAEPSLHQAQDRANVCERAIRFSPAQSLVTRCAVQIALAGRNSDAADLLRSARRAYPLARADIARELAVWSKKFPDLLTLTDLVMRE